MGMSASAQKEKLDCYYHLKHMIDNGDIGAVEIYMEDNNLTHASFKKCDSWMSDKDHVYPVFVAARCGNVDILNYLLSIGFSHTFGWETTSMLEAIKHGHIAIVKVLVELHGVDVDDIYFPYYCIRETALRAAASAGQLEIFQYLLEMGASIETADNVIHETLLHAAVTGQNEQIVKILSQYIDVDIAVEPGHNITRCMTPLTWAALHDNGKILTALLDAGAEIEGNESTSNRTDTPFNTAVFDDKLENAKILYSAGANPEARSKLFCNGTPLTYAIESGNYEMVRYLVVELNLPWEENLDRCPLDLALSYNRRSIIKLLIEAGFSSGVRTQQEHYSGIYPDKSNLRILKQICCFKVRRLLERNLSRGIDTIPLPRPLIDFIKLTHIPLHRPNTDDI